MILENGSSFLILENNFFDKNFQVLTRLEVLPKITTKYSLSAFDGDYEKYF